MFSWFEADLSRRTDREYDNGTYHKKEIFTKKLYKERYMQFHLL